MGFYEDAARENERMRRGRVWCTVCGRTQSVKTAQALASGWPTCCGYTMTIDSPQERTPPRGGVTKGGR